MVSLVSAGGEVTHRRQRRADGESVGAEGGAGSGPVEDGGAAATHLHVERDPRGIVLMLSVKTSKRYLHAQCVRETSRKAHRAYSISAFHSVCATRAAMPASKKVRLARTFSQYSIRSDLASGR